MTSWTGVFVMAALACGTHLLLAASRKKDTRATLITMFLIVVFVVVCTLGFTALAKALQ